MATNDSEHAPNNSWSEALSQMRKELVNLLEYAVITELESIDRSLTELWNQNRRLMDKLRAHGIPSECHDQLHKSGASSGTPMEWDEGDNINVPPTTKPQKQCI